MSRARMLGNPTIVKLAEIRHQQSEMKTEKEQLEVQKENQKAQFASPEKWSRKRKVSLVLRAAEKTGKQRTNVTRRSLVTLVGWVSMAPSRLTPDCRELKSCMWGKQMVMMSATCWHLPRAFASDWTTIRAFAICLCCCGCRPSTPPEGNSGWTERHSILQGNWWNGSLYSYIFSGTDFMIPILAHLLVSREALNPFMVTSALREEQKTFSIISAWLHWTPPPPKSYILTFPCCPCGAVSKNYPRFCLLDCGPHFAPNKT